MREGKKQPLPGTTAWHEVRVSLVLWRHFLSPALILPPQPCTRSTCTPLTALNITPLLPPVQLSKVTSEEEGGRDSGDSPALAAAGGTGSLCWYVQREVPSHHFHTPAWLFFL